MGLLKRQPGAQIWHNVRTETIPIIVAGYKIWPIASIISFTFVPVQRRIVFLSFVGLLWGIYMSLVAARVTMPLVRGRCRRRRARIARPSRANVMSPGLQQPYPCRTVFASRPVDDTMRS